MALTYKHKSVQLDVCHLLGAKKLIFTVTFTTHQIVITIISTTTTIITIIIFYYFWYFLFVTPGTKYHGG